MHIPQIDNISQAAKDPSFLTIRPWCIFLLSCIILYLPPGIAELTPPIVGVAVERIASFIPSVSRWAELSPFSWNTKLFLVFAWIMIPIQACWLISSKKLRQFYKDSYHAKNMSRSTLVRLFGILGFSFFMGALIYLALNFAIVDTPPCHVCVNTNRLAQLFVGCVYSMTISMGLVFLATSLSALMNHSVQAKENNCV